MHSASPGGVTATLGSSFFEHFTKAKVFYMLPFIYVPSLVEIGLGGLQVISFLSCGEQC